MKKLIAALSLGILVTGSAYAQTTPRKDQKPRSEYRGAKADKTRKSPEEMAQLRTDKMAQRLELNASQKNQLQALNMRHAREMKALREGHKAGGEKTADDRARMQEARRASHDKWQAELKGILTEQQYAEYEADREQMQQKRAEMRKGTMSDEHRKSGEYKKRGEHRRQHQG